MSSAGERLLELLPGVYGRGDEDGALAELLGLVGEELDKLERGVEQLYDDQFVETCAPWLLPYLGELVGATCLPGPPLSSRAEVAHTIAYRRRKGTAAVLEQLAADIAGLPARAVEFFELLAATQNLNHPRAGATGAAAGSPAQPACQAFVDVRDARRLEQLGGPFERLGALPSLTHSVDVRRIAAGRGRYAIANVGVFLWRLRSHSLTRSPATAEGGGGRRFRFSPLGQDAPLFNLPETEDELTHVAEPRNVPAPISRRAAVAEPELVAASVQVDAGAELAGAEVVVCDLGSWRGAAGAIAVDPVLGRLVLPAVAESPPLVSFRYGFSASIGGGEYWRPLAAEAPDAAVVRVKPGAGAIQAAIDALPRAGGVVEIAGSGRYEEGSLTVGARGRRVTLRAAARSRPTVILGGGELAIEGDEAGSVRIEGLLLAGGGVAVRRGADGGGLGTLEIAHTTLVPGIGLLADGTPARPDPALVVEAPRTEVSIERSIVGPVRCGPDAGVRIADSVLDATDRTRVAFSSVAGSDGAPLRLEGTTVIGRIRAEALQLVSNSLFLARVPAGADPAEWPGPVLARRCQQGCVRFSYVPPGSRTPRRFRCPPERSAGAAIAEPLLVSSRYGRPEYCQLAAATPAQVREGAEDGGEPGAFHHLGLPQREAHLRTRLGEHLRFGLEAGVIHAN